MLNIEKFKIFYKAINAYQSPLLLVPQTDRNLAARAALDYFNFLNEPEKYATEANKKYLIAKIWALYHAKYFDRLMCGIDRNDIEAVVEDINQGGIAFLDMPVQKRGVFLHRKRAFEKPSIPTANVWDEQVFAPAPGFEFLTHQDQQLVINQTLFDVQQLIRQSEFRQAITLCKKRLSEIEATAHKIGKPNIQYALVTAIDFYIAELNSKRPKDYRQLIHCQLASIHVWEEINAKITSGNRDYQFLDKKELFCEYGLLAKLHYESRFDVNGSLEDLDHSLTFLKKGMAYFHENYDVEFILNYHYDESDINLLRANLQLLISLYLYHMQFERLYMFFQKPHLSMLELEKAFLLLQQVLDKLRDNPVVGPLVVEFAQVKLEELYRAIRQYVAANRLEQNWETLVPCIRLAMNVIDMLSTIPDVNPVPKYRIFNVEFLSDIHDTVRGLLSTKNKHADKLYDLLVMEYSKILFKTGVAEGLSEPIAFYRSNLIKFRNNLPKTNLTIEKFKIFYKAINSYEPSLPTSHPVVRLATDYFNFLNEPKIYANEKNKKYLIAKVRALFATDYFRDFLTKDDINEVVEDIEANGAVFAKLPVAERGVFLHKNRVKQTSSVLSAKPMTGNVFASSEAFIFDMLNQRILLVQHLIKQQKFAEAIALCKTFLKEIEVTKQKPKKTNFQYELAVALDCYFKVLCLTCPNNLLLIIQVKLESILAWEGVNPEIMTIGLPKKAMFEEYGELAKLYYRKYSKDRVFSAAKENLDHAVSFFNKAIAEFEQYYGVGFVLNFPYDASSGNLLRKNIDLLKTLFSYHIKLADIYQDLENASQCYQALNAGFVLLKQMVSKFSGDAAAADIVSFARSELEDMVPSVINLCIVCQKNKNANELVVVLKFAIEFIQFAAKIDDHSTLPDQFQLYYVNLLMLLTKPVSDLMKEKHKAAPGLYMTVIYEYAMFIADPAFANAAKNLCQKRRSLIELKTKLRKQELEVHSHFAAADGPRKPGKEEVEDQADSLNQLRKK